MTASASIRRFAGTSPPVRAFGAGARVRTPHRPADRRCSAVLAGLMDWLSARRMPVLAGSSPSAPPVSCSRHPVAEPFEAATAPAPASDPRPAWCRPLRLPRLRRFPPSGPPPPPPPATDPGEARPRAQRRRSRGAAGASGTSSAAAASRRAPCVGDVRAYGSSLPSARLRRTTGAAAADIRDPGLPPQRALDRRQRPDRQPSRQTTWVATPRASPRICPRQSSAPARARGTCGRSSAPVWGSPPPPLPGVDAARPAGRRRGSSASKVLNRRPDGRLQGPRAPAVEVEPPRGAGRRPDRSRRRRPGVGRASPAASN